MLTLLTTLISFLAGGLPKLLGFFQDRADKKHELTMVRKEKIAPGTATLLATIKYKCPEGERVVQYPRHANLSFDLRG